ncbi:MAG: class I tRNA ligase family protein [bacterium]|nr:class I tRNA ligase family protein [bacterium]
MKSYDHKKIEKKWQREWSKAKIYKTPDSVKGKDNFHLLVEFPYPSGNLHVGHWYAFALPDILARALRMQGKNVLYPIGFDAFGLPAENAAIKNKLNPRKWTEENIAYMKNQISSMGTSFDWSREVITCDPDYYKWTQWLFLQLFKKGLVYQKETAVNWCPKDKTVLANEQVVDGKCERCDTEVMQKQMLQWNIKITDYADRLIDDLVSLNWPEQIKESQRNWIGRSEGAEIDFPLNVGRKYKYVLLHGFEGRPDRPRFQFWKSELEAQGHEVIIPALPNPDNPSEVEQVEAALHTTHYDENTVLFGHSLGAVVAMKVLEKLKNPIARLVLAGGFVDRNFKDRPRNFDKRFVWKFDGNKIKKNTDSITILHDPNDPSISEDQKRNLENVLTVKAELVEGEVPHYKGEKELPVLRWLRPTITAFTTRADTLYGATYLVLAPEHPWIKLAIQHSGFLRNEDEVGRYIALSAKKTDMDRQTNREKTGLKLDGVEATNPATGEKIPVYIADYVLGHYGTGAIMAVPAHDERDFEFAQKFNLPITEVVEPFIIRNSGVDALNPNLPLKERNAVEVILKHWSEDKYLCLQLKKRDLRTFISGKVEEGEDLQTAALREIREETGYKNPRFVRHLGGKIHVQFFHPWKEENVFAHFSPMLFELVDGEQEDIAQSEKDIHEAVWVQADKIPDFVNRGDFLLPWSRFHGTNVYTGEGILTGSGSFDGVSTSDARIAITAKFGIKKTTYKLRDWIVSRQRYWGVPIPVIHCKKCGSVAVEDKNLPVKLPEVKDYLPEGSGKSPLAKVAKFVKVKCPKCGENAERETDTLDTFVDSSWYFLRYTDPKNKKEFAAKNKQKNWMPVDLYSGGAEHTTMHVLYSRFWHKALFDLGLVADSEPYVRRMNRSLILGPDGQKMSKSRGNVIDPDDIVARFGADTVRLYLAFIGPYNEVSSYPWNPDGVVGIRRFLERISRVEDIVVDENVAILDSQLHKTIKKVGEDITALKFNTAVSALMILLNGIEKSGKLGKDQYSVFLKLLAPFAPHLAEELWRGQGNEEFIHQKSWPIHDAKFLKDDMQTIIVQIDGKTRANVSVPPGSQRDAVEKAATEAAGTRLEGKKILRTIYVPGRLVNFVLEKG